MGWFSGPSLYGAQFLIYEYEGIFLKPVKAFITDVKVEGHTPLGDRKPSKKQGGRKQKVGFSSGEAEQSVHDRTAEKKRNQG